MNRSDFLPRLRAARAAACRELLEARETRGHWVGELSTSALSTATAVCALSIVEKHAAKAGPRHTALIQGGLDWLAQNQNSDGGWGDTTSSLSNISTTALCWAAFGAVPGGDERHGQTVASAASWLAQRAGGIHPELLAPAIIKRYGKDRTFSVPILMTCVLAGRFGSGRDAWMWVLPLPFELAACPHAWFAALRLPVVSYALPALIAIGHARHHHRPSANPVARLLRSWTRTRTLAKLQAIQPSSGGFLEATPLTSFVVMSLAAAGNVGHTVTKRGVEFLVNSVRADGSWPIDTNLATWVTTLSVNALSSGSQPGSEAALETARMDETERRAIREWLLTQQYREEHPYTHAAPGGWAWTDLPGGVPDADDTAGALVALRDLGSVDDRTRAAAAAGITWLLNLQNRDGGIPTFCRGWGALPFDRSGADLTAHALRAWAVWRDEVSSPLRKRINRASASALQYLMTTQRADGSWAPLWFGNQFAPHDENLTYGTARVVIALAEIAAPDDEASVAPLRRGVQWLLEAQNAGGSWGGFPGGAASTEETALAVHALASALANPTILVDEDRGAEKAHAAVTRGTQWLVERVESGAWKTPSPIGFYFAKLWYYEKLYPQIGTAGALLRAERLF